MTAPVFGATRRCHACKGTGTSHERQCLVCAGRGYFDDRPAVARRHDPSTSHEAAESISPDSLRRSQQFVLDTLRRYGPLCDVALFRKLTELGYPISESGARTRRSELAAKGLVVDTGRRETLVSGRKAIVWEAVQ